MGIFEKINRFQERNKNRVRGEHLKGIFHTWQDGENHLRLVGEFLEVHTHFIAPSAKIKSKGFCQDSAFNRVKGDNKNFLPKVVNCGNWDIEKEEETARKPCVVCRLGKIAAVLLRNEATDEKEKKFLQALKGACAPRVQLKWNILDRDNPLIVQVDESGKEEKVLGFKIASIGTEAWKDIEGIFHQLDADIADPDNGVDIVVTKSYNGTRDTYSATVVFEKMKAKVTPLTQEERLLVPHELKQRCGLKVDQGLILASLHEEYAGLLESYGELVPDDTEEVVAAEASEIEETTKAAPARPVAPSKKLMTPPPAKENESNEFEEEQVPAPAPKPMAKAPSVAKPAAPKPAINKPVVSKPAPKAPEKAPASDEFEVEPETFDCFGEYDPNHSECKECKGADACKKATK